MSTQKYTADENNFIGKKIRSERKQRNLTLEKMAESLGVSLGYLGEVERGESKVNEKIISGLRLKYSIDLYAAEDEAIKSHPSVTDLASALDQIPSVKLDQFIYEAQKESGLNKNETATLKILMELLIAAGPEDRKRIIRKLNTLAAEELTCE
jgi:transcriptional regulator with XRE-family HTH domain